MSSLSATDFPPRTASQDRAWSRGLPAGRLPAARLAAFSALAIPVAAAQVPLNIYLPALLAQHYGLALSTLGLVFLIEKAWGAVADPLIGALCDRTGARLGRRGWIAGGGLLFGAAILLLFFPVAQVSAAYLLPVLFAFYLGWSTIQIPYYAWSASISADYDERTRIATYQQVAAALALVLTLILPTILDQVAPKDAALKLACMGGLFLVMLTVALPLTLAAFPEPPAPRASLRRPGLAETLRAFWTTPLLTRVLASDFAVTFGQNVRAALFVFFVSDYMGLPRWSSGLFLAQFVFGVFAGPIWMRIGYRFGKHRTAVAAELLQAAINLGLLFVTRGDFVTLAALTLAQGLSQGSGNLMLRAMVADVADQERLRTGEDRTALFFSVFSVSTKAAMAAAIGIALPLVGWLGFAPKAAVNSPQALHGLLLVFALGPALAHIASALLINGFPLDAKAHTDVRRRLAERDALSPGPAE
jgi:Na+/melibiose symporter-like transporter